MKFSHSSWCSSCTMMTGRSPKLRAAQHAPTVTKPQIGTKYRSKIPKSYLNFELPLVIGKFHSLRVDVGKLYKSRVPIFTLLEVYHLGI